MFNKYCKGHYFLNIVHLVRMGMIAVTEGLQFSLLDVDFYCSISCKWETEGKRLLACKNRAYRRETVCNCDEIQRDLIMYSIFH